MPAPHLFPRNDNLVFIRGLVDAADPTNADGSPKWINDATGTWEVRDAEYPSGSVVASGSIIPLAAGGAYRIELSDSIAIAAEADYWLHVVVTSGSYQADLSDSFRSLARTGRTAVT